MIYTRIEALSSLKPTAKWHWIGEDYSGLNWIDSSTKPTEAERDKRLSDCDWRASSDLTLSDSWKTYRQALRDLPASASPKLDSNGYLDMTSITFPTEPS